MTSAWTIAPILLPLLAGAVLLLLRARPRLQAALNLLATFALLLIVLRLAGMAAEGELAVYLLGNWPPPFAIVLALDRLSALMLVLTALVACASLVHAVMGGHAAGGAFHPLFQLQLMGLNGAFLTADLFNLFVFFEVLLIASYGLLLHGGGARRIRSGLHYVAINLVGSALFLVAVSLLYGLAGTLNMADLAVKVAALPEADGALLRSAALLLLMVFCLKAAVVPLGLWLPDVYESASAPVAALFAIMTKIGVYAVARVYSLIFGPDAGTAASVGAPWLLAFGMLTLACGALAAVAAARVRNLAACLIIASAGTLLATLGLGGRASTGGALFYLIDSTLAAAALFLLADLLSRQRAGHEDALRPGPRLERPAIPAILFFIASMSVVGIPPLAGFIGKLMILDGARGSTPGWTLWAVILGTSFLVLIAMSRAGSFVFWNVQADTPSAPGLPRASALPAAALLAIGVCVAVAAAPVQRYVQAAADQLHAPAGYIAAVLGTVPATGHRP